MVAELRLVEQRVEEEELGARAAAVGQRGVPRRRAHVVAVEVGGALLVRRLRADRARRQRGELGEGRRPRRQPPHVEFIQWSAGSAPPPPALVQTKRSLSGTRRPPPPRAPTPARRPPAAPPARRRAPRRAATAAAGGAAPARAARPRRARRRRRRRRRSRRRAARARRRAWCARAAAVGAFATRPWSAAAQRPKAAPSAPLASYAASSFAASHSTQPTAGLITPATCSSTPIARSASSGSLSPSGIVATRTSAPAAAAAVSTSCEARRETALAPCLVAVEVEHDAPRRRERRRRQQLRLRERGAEAGDGVGDAGGVEGDRVEVPLDDDDLAGGARGVAREVGAVQRLALLEDERLGRVDVLGLLERAGGGGGGAVEDARAKGDDLALAVPDRDHQPAGEAVDDRPALLAVPRPREPGGDELVVGRPAARRCSVSSAAPAPPGA